MKAIIATAIIKGGTGKSTTAGALAQAAALKGYKVLAIDLEPQANLTARLGAEQNSPGSYELLHGEEPAGLIQNTEQKIDVIAGGPDLATERTTPASGKRLQQAIEPLKEQYDYIFIDTPPQIGELTLNALQAATGLIIPLETDDGSLQGLYQITDIAHQIQRGNPNLHILGAIVTKHEGRTNVNKSLLDAIAEAGAEIEAPLLGVIRKGIAVREAHILQQSLFEYAGRSNPAKDYMKLFETIEEVLKK